MGRANIIKKVSSFTSKLVGRDRSGTELWPGDGQSTGACPSPNGAVTSTPALRLATPPPAHSPVSVAEEVTTPRPAADGACSAAGLAQQAASEPAVARDDAPAAPANVGCECFFARVPTTATHHELLALFSRFGSVANLNLFRAFAEAKSSKGCGIVRFADGAAAAAAKAALHNKHSWEGADSGAPMVLEAVNLDKKRTMISADGASGLIFKPKFKGGRAAAPTTRQRTTAPAAAASAAGDVDGLPLPDQALPGDALASWGGEFEPGSPLPWMPAAGAPGSFSSLSSTHSQPKRNAAGSGGGGALPSPDDMTSLPPALLGGGSFSGRQQPPPPPRRSLEHQRRQQQTTWQRQQQQQMMMTSCGAPPMLLPTFCPLLERPPHNSSGSGFASIPSALAASGACASGGLAALSGGCLQQQQHAAACTASHPQLYRAAAAATYETQQQQAQQQQQQQQQAALSSCASGSLPYLACGFSVVPAAPELFASVGVSQAGWAGAVVAAGQQLQPASMLPCGSSGAGLLGDLSVGLAGGCCEAYGPGLLSDQLPSMFANNSNIYSGYIHSQLLSAYEGGNSSQGGLAQCSAAAACGPMSSVAAAAAAVAGADSSSANVLHLGNAQLDMMQQQMLWQQQQQQQLAMLSGSCQAQQQQLVSGSLCTPATGVCQAHGLSGPPNNAAVAQQQQQQLLSDSSCWSLPAAADAAGGYFDIYRSSTKCAKANEGRGVLMPNATHLEAEIPPPHGSGSLFPDAAAVAAAAAAAGGSAAVVGGAGAGTAGSTGQVVELHVAVPQAAVPVVAEHMGSIAALTHAAVCISADGGGGGLGVKLVGSCEQVELAQKVVQLLLTRHCC